MPRRCLAALLLLILAVPAAAQPADVLAETRARLAEGNPDAASTLLREAETLDADGAFLLGLAEQAAYRPALAARAFAQADTSQARVQAAWARSLVALGREGEALAHYGRAYRADTSAAAVAVPYARLLARRQQADSARVVWRRLVRQEPDNPLFRSHLGDVLAQVDSLEEAAIQLERAHRLDLAGVETAVRLAGVYLALDQPISARRVLERSLEARPEQPELWEARGDVAMREDDAETAADAFGRALANGDSTATRLHKRGAALYLHAAYDSSPALLQRAWAADTTRALTAHYLGMAFQQTGELDSALVYLRRTTELMEQRTLADVHTQIGVTLNLQDRPGEAIPSYRLAERLAPEKTDVLFHLAVAYERYYADAEAAVEHYTAFLDRPSVAERFPAFWALARQRLADLRERQFFNGELPVDSATTMPDTARGE